MSTYPYKPGDVVDADGLNRSFDPLYAGGAAAPSSAPPLMNGVAAPGVSTLYSRADHVHPSDTNYLPLSGGTMTGPLTFLQAPAFAGSSIAIQSQGAVGATGAQGFIAYQQLASSGHAWRFGVDVNGNFTLLDDTRGAAIVAWFSNTDGTLTTGAGINMTGGTFNANANNIVTSGNLWANVGNYSAGIQCATLSLGTNTSAGWLVLNGPLSTARQVPWRTAGLNTWQASLGGGQTGSGNVGADWRLDRYDDSGAFLGNPILITRATGRVQLSAVAPGHLIGGVSDGTNVTTGYVGEFLSLAVSSGSAVSYPSTSVFQQVGTLTLSAGDWDVSGAVGYNNTGATITQVQGFVTTTAPPTNPGGVTGGAMIFIGSVGSGSLMPVTRYRVSSNASTTVYLVAYVAFTGGTVSVWGYMSARRAR